MVLASRSLGGVRLREGEDNPEKKCLADVEDLFVDKDGSVSLSLIIFFHVISFDVVNNTFTFSFPMTLWT